MSRYGISYAPVDTMILKNLWCMHAWYVRLFMAYVGEVGALITDKDSTNYTKFFIATAPAVISVPSKTRLS